MRLKLASLAILLTCACGPQEPAPRNVILFVGDGMGLGTVVAARILEGQRNGEAGPGHQLSFEKFPHTALLKTYLANQQVADSAGAITSLVTGTKSRAGMISMGPGAVRSEVQSAQGHQLTTILERCEDRGIATGIVTTTRVTHATPAALYAHSVEREWERDSEVDPSQASAGAVDIAIQFVEFGHGDGIEVVLGGGRKNFLGDDVRDPEHARRTGSRIDEDINLIERWQERYQERRTRYIWDQDGFDSVVPGEVDMLLGLFEPGHMLYEHERENEPSLSAMTAKAIEILERDPDGFFLMVEGGRIDHAHHKGNAFRALNETLEFARAVELAVAQTDPRETLILVTADHAHGLTISGYPVLDNPILGLVTSNWKPKHLSVEKNTTFRATDLGGRPFTTLLYPNGPGFLNETHEQAEGPKQFEHIPTTVLGPLPRRGKLSPEQVQARDYLQEVGIPLGEGTHSGEDVPIYATGPCASLFHGVMEQSAVHDLMALVLGLEMRPEDRELLRRRLAAVEAEAGRLRALLDP